MNDNPDYLVTGFCLGMQTMNVAAGGSLYQDIPAQIYESYRPETNVLSDRRNLHRNYFQEISSDSDLMYNNLHPVRFTESTFFGHTVRVSHKLQPLVYSSHHQAVRELATVLRSLLSLLTVKWLRVSQVQSFQMSSRFSSIRRSQLSMKTVPR